jgi:hypothetical protein
MPYYVHGILILNNNNGGSNDNVNGGIYSPNRHHRKFEHNTTMGT